MNSMTDFDITIFICFYIIENLFVFHSFLLSPFYPTLILIIHNILFFQNELLLILSVLPHDVI